MGTNRAALKLVESPSWYRREVDLFADESATDFHTMHHAIALPEGVKPEVPAYLIKKYTAKGAVVLDPFSTSGTVALEAALLGRVSYASALSPLAVRVTEAKLLPADITEVTLKLQEINLRRPIMLEEYSQVFAPFYDVDTFREIFNLRNYLLEREDHAARFIQLIALSLLHGHSAGFFSVYTFPQVSVSSENQRAINAKRRQTPDYRAVVPRILRKTASVLRDGWHTSFRKLAPDHRVRIADPRDLGFVPNNSVSLVVTSPPVPGGPDYRADLWLRDWFMAASTANHETAVFPEAQMIDEWIDYMNETLMELARVVIKGGRVVFNLREVNKNSSRADLSQPLINLVQDSLSKFWDIEGVLLPLEKRPKLSSSALQLSSERLLVLRRR